MTLVMMESKFDHLLDELQKKKKKKVHNKLNAVPTDNIIKNISQ